MRFSLLVLTLSLFSALGAAQPARVLTANQQKTLSGSGMSFVENKGQWDAQVHYVAKAGGLNMWVTEQGLVMDYHQFVPEANQTRDPMDRHWRPKGTVYGDVVRMTLDKAQPTALSGQTKLKGDENYFIGNDPSRWASSCHRYTEAMAESPYPGISVRYYFDQGSPRYDLVVKPGADASEVAFKVEGVQGLRVREDGNLELSTPYGTIVQKGLTAYQESGGTRRQIPCRMTVDGDRIRFDAGAYDQGKELVIDPLLSSTYLGGSGIDGDQAFAAAIDAAGEPVIAGRSTSSDFPLTAGAYQTTNTHGEEAFVSKFSADGTELLASTFLGGGGDSAFALALDSSGNPVIAGETQSSNFPVTTGVFQQTNQGLGGGINGFISKLSADGTTLLASTYLGGNNEAGPDGDFVSALVLDGSGNPVISGHTSSTNFPVTAGAYQQKNALSLGGFGIAFVSKLSADFTKLLASTYLGGAADGAGDYAYAVALDSSGDPVIAGSSGSDNFPVTTGVYQTTNRGGLDAFVSKLSADCTKLLASTYLGGATGDAEAYALALDSSGGPVIAGYTASTDFPITAGAYQKTNNGRSTGFGTNAFVSKLNADFTKLLASTYLGGSGSKGHLPGDQANAIVLDLAGNPIIAGFSDSSNFPVTAGAYQTSIKGTYNAFVAKLSADCTGLLASTYLGGSRNDNAKALVLDAVGNPIITGSTDSRDFPLTVDAYQTTLNGGLSAFVSKLSSPLLLAGLTVAPTAVVGGTQATGTVTLGSLSNFSGGSVSLLSSNAAIASFSESVIVDPTGRANFVITTTPVTVTTLVSVTATWSSSSIIVHLYVVPLAVASMIPSSSNVIGGQNVTMTLTLNGVALPGGSTVNLGTGGPCSTQGTLKVPAGQVSTQLTVNTSAVASSTLAYVSATLGSTTVTTHFYVLAPTVTSLTAYPQNVVGGSSSSLTLDLSGPAPSGGPSVGIATSGPCSATPTVPVVVGQSSVQFPVSTIPVATTTLAYVTASYGASTKTAHFYVLAPAVSSLIALPQNVVGGSSSSLTLDLSGPAPTTGLSVAISTSGPCAATSSVPFSKGQSSVQFSVTSTPAATTTLAFVTATYGASTKTAHFYVLAPSIASLTVSPQNVVSGKTTTLTLTLSGPAPAGGITINLAASGPCTPPVSVPVKVGQEQVQFSVTAGTVTTATLAYVTATYGASTKTTHFYVLP